MELTFLGGAETVTGSRYLLEFADQRILVDCGLFQGLKKLRLKNWAPFAVDPGSIDAVILTHAHLDHSGYLPALVRDGFTGPIYSTQATRDLCNLLLRDSGHLAEEDAARANRHGYSRHKPALPLYTEADAQKAMLRFQPIRFGAEITLAPGRFVMQRAGHLPGAATVTFIHEKCRVVFSGDMGRPHDPILRPPEKIARADYLVLESTYGDREHVEADPSAALADVIRSTAARGGVVVVPAFAVGRTQVLLYYLQQLMEQGSIPSLPVYLDSPMAAEATDLLFAHDGEHTIPKDRIKAIRAMVSVARTVEDSRAIDRHGGPMIVISASGMATGGRILFHLEQFATNPRNTILFTGHQAVGTRGSAMIAGAASVKIHGREVPVRADVVMLPALSGHADASELLDWLRAIEIPPRMTFITHGEPAAADTLRRRITDVLHWEVTIPHEGERRLLM